MQGVEVVEGVLPSLDDGFKGLSIEELEKVPKLKGFPVKTKQIAAKIEGIHTEIIINVYLDYVFIIITQTNKIGTIIEATKDQDQYFEGESEGSFSVKVHIGKRDDDLNAIYGRQLAQLVDITSSTPRGLILGLGLRENKGNERTTFSKIYHLIHSQKIW
eukprot:TRINITY_DN6823_c0_g1_i1.p1 TRINITY_DN6823_c0_g1~~TRINITY_DN6823_c0_g1_i1.p1  ORF type:complete len:160 (+),score=18.24 TRINITY_DN6823_c0_g1_i1:26-505(+)